MELEVVTGMLLNAAQTGAVDVFLADATLYLEMTGHIAIAWQWLVQGAAATRALVAGTPDQHFYAGKRDTCAYFFKYELPKIHGLAVRLKQCDGFTARMDVRHFED